jgi:enoyl-CoA hydratase/carnithine racemase
MEFEQIRYEVADGILTITLNRPDRLNAWTPVMQQELIEALDAADADDDVRVVVFTGEGRGYCAGADLAAGGSTFERGEQLPAEEHRDGGGVFTLRAFESTKPLIAAINGPAVGVGITMTLPMDVRLASENARFGFVFVRRGIVPEAASSWFLPRIVGISQAMEWVATGRVFDAAEALAGRLVSRVVPAADLLPAARAIAGEIAANTSAVSVTLSRRMLWSMLGASSPWDAHRADSRAIWMLGPGPDAAEGVQSFLDKRPPRFPARVADYLDVIPEWPLPPADLA